MASPGVDADVAAIREYWGSELEYEEEELFAIAQRQREEARGADKGARDFVLQVVACRLEEHLLRWFLQSHAADAADDLQVLLAACSDPYFSNGGELLEPILDVMLTAAVVQAAACDPDRKNRKRRMAALLTPMETRESRACCTMRELVYCDVVGKNGVAWTQFLKLPHALDARLFNSRSGRTFMDEAGQIIALQQFEMAQRRKLTDEYDNMGFRGTKGSSDEDILWRLADQLVEVSLKAHLEEAVQNSSVDGFTTSLSTVKSTAELENHLKTGAASPVASANDDISRHPELVDSVGEMSPMKQLASLCDACAGDELAVSSELLERVFKELSSIKCFEVLAIHASFLLSLQIRSNASFVYRCEPARYNFEQRVRKVLNQLTGTAKDLEHTSSLVTLSALCPGQLIQQFIRGARIDTQRHAVYLSVLRSSPLLANWNEGEGDGTWTLLERELQQTLIDISSNQNNFERESQNVVLFLLSLVGISTNNFPVSGSAVMTISKFLDGILIPLLSTLDDQSCSAQTLLNLYTLVLQVLDNFVAEQNISPTALQSVFNHTTTWLCFPVFNDLRFGVLLREKLLLLLKKVMEVSEIAPTIMFEQLETPLSPSIWTLFSLFNCELGDDESCKGLEEVAAIEAYMQEKSGDTFLPSLPLPRVISAVKVLIWGLLWDSTLSENVSLESTEDESWRLLDNIAKYEFTGESAEQRVKGSLLIQTAVAEIMLECGSVLFQILYDNIIPYLLSYEPIAAKSECLSIPEWSAGSLPEKPDIELLVQLPCYLVSTHAIMRYVAKCWGLSGAVNIEIGATPSVLLGGSFGHVLAAHEQAVISSQRSLSGTLFCIQWLCYLVSACYEIHLDTTLTWLSVRTQVELSLLRLLNQLDQLQETSIAKAHFSKYFVAAWLAYLPAGQFEQIFNFLASKASQ